MQTITQNIVNTIVNSLQLNIAKNSVINTEVYTAHVVLTITNVTFNKNAYFTYKNFVEETMYISNNVANVLYTNKTVTVYILQQFVSTYIEENYVWNKQHTYVTLMGSKTVIINNNNLLHKVLLHYINKGFCYKQLLQFCNFYNSKQKYFKQNKYVGKAITQYYANMQYEVFMQKLQNATCCKFLIQYLCMLHVWEIFKAALIAQITLNNKQILQLAIYYKYSCNIFEERAFKH